MLRQQLEFAHNMLVGHAGEEEAADEVVDADRPTEQHGTPPRLLRCEFAAVGYAQVGFRELRSAGGYLATFRAAGRRPDPAKIVACRMK